MGVDRRVTRPRDVGLGHAELLPRSEVLERQALARVAGHGTQPLRPLVATPSITYFWTKMYKSRTGTAAMVAPAITTG